LATEGLLEGRRRTSNAERAQDALTQLSAALDALDPVAPHRGEPHGGAA
jgi:hypothetical protein